VAPVRLSGGDDVFEGDLGPGFHAIEAFFEEVEGGPFGGHEIGFVDAEIGAGGLEDEDESEVNLADGGAVVGDDAAQVEGLALAEQVNFFVEFAFEAGVQNVLAGAEDFEVVDVAADADGTFAVEPFFGLFAGALHEEEFVGVTHEDVGNDLFEAGVVFDGGAAAEGMVREDVVEDGLEVGAGEAAAEERVDAGGRDDEDVFFVHARMLGTGMGLSNRFHLVRHLLPSAPTRVGVEIYGGLFWRRGQYWKMGCRGLWRLGMAGAFALLLLGGCATGPVNELRAGEDPDGVMGSVMARQDRIVHMSIGAKDSGKPVLLLLHGATDDPTEMMDIVRQCRGAYDVYLYSFNYHARVEKVGANLEREINLLREANPLASSATVIVYSYSAIVFRQCVVGARDASIFAGMTLIQLAPTAGGSHQARWMRTPLIGSLAGMASKPSAAENPYGRRAKRLWGGAGNRKFNEAIPPDRVFTVLLEKDSHSLAHSSSAHVRERYRNGIGSNVVVIPKAAGVPHDFLPTSRTALEYLAELMQRISTQAVALQEKNRAGLGQK